MTTFNLDWSAAPYSAGGSLVLPQMP